MSKAEKTRLILITGATKGLGKAMAVKFASLGHTVVGCGRSTVSVAGLRKQLPTPHRFDVIDVANDCQVADWAESVLSQVGVPDLLLNNAAIINQNAAPQIDPTLDPFSPKNGYNPNQSVFGCSNASNRRRELQPI